MFEFTYMDVKLNFNWQLKQAQQNHEIEPLLFELLEFIQTHGSLKKAADLSKVSYRHAWGLIKLWHTYFGQPLVILEKGRGAHLSALGEHLINSNMQLKARFLPELENFSTQFKRELESLSQQAEKDSLNIFASHGLAIGALRDLIGQQTDFKLDLHFHGSLESLSALSNGNCDIAGFHIPIGPVAEPLLSHYLGILTVEGYELIYVVKRNQGLIFKRNNPKNITGLDSLTRPDIRFINRQTGSGTRLLFDQLLKNKHVNPEEIQGYNQEEFTHLAVAALVASDAADVSFGIAPMAEQFNLGFLPVIWEHYCLAVPKTLIDDERVKQIISLLKCDDYCQLIAHSRGYQCQQSGNIVAFDDIFS